ncbi:MAG: hypothetical protein WCC31_00945 [Terracidiphilus sp.]
MSAEELKRDVLSALAGKQAGRERAVAEKTRRVVLASAGVMKDQMADRKRSKSLALASILLMVLALGPFIWRVSDDIIGGEHWSDIATQTSLWVCVLCPALLAAALVAGWSRINR